jgi:hypothetical protein
MEKANSFTATRPPNALRTPFSASRGSPATRQLFSGRRKIAHGERHDAFARALQQQHQQHAENDHFEIAALTEELGQQILQPLLEHGEYPRPHHCTPD